MKRIGKRADGLIDALLTPDEYEAVRELPPPPVCMFSFCRESGPHMTQMPYGSKHDGEWMCPKCLDEAIDLLKAKRGG